MNRAVHLLLAVTVLVTARPVSAQLIEDYRFKGAVVDTKGNPVADVQVSLYDIAKGSRIVFKSKDDGTFDRRMIPSAVYEVTFEKPGYVPMRERFDWSTGATETIVMDKRVILESEEEKRQRDMAQAKAEMGKKANKLYQDTYDAFTAGNCPEAAQKAQELLGLEVGNFEYAVRFILARCALQQGQIAPAEADYRRVIALKPEMFEAHFDLGVALEQQGKFDDALGAFQRAAELRPGDAATQYEIGAIHFKGGRFDQALPHLRAATELNPRNGQAFKALGFTLISADKKDFAQAKAALEKYLELEPAAADAAQVKQICKEIK
jgi:tetratricopeptide (TPR) repeat protein